jgi:hypothetical protein
MSIWPTTLLMLTGTFAAVIELIEIWAGAPMVTVMALEPQTEVYPATVEQADTTTVPPVEVDVMVTRPEALTDRMPVVPVGCDQVTVCDGLFAPWTAAASWIGVEPVFGRCTLTAFGVTVTLVTVGVGAATTVRLAAPQTDVLTVEQAVMATGPVKLAGAVTRPVALTVTEALELVQVTVVATPASAFTAAVICSVVPAVMFTPEGATLML